MSDGMGIKLPIEEKSQTPKDTPKPAKSWSSEWGPKASIAYQLVKHPDKVRRGPLILRQLDVNKESEQIDRIHARLHPEESPEIIITKSDLQFSPVDGNYKILLAYQELEYQQIV